MGFLLQNWHYIRKIGRTSDETRTLKEFLKIKKASDLACLQ